jgi:hypothetical protein
MIRLAGHAPLFGDPPEGEKGQRQNLAPSSITKNSGEANSTNSTASGKLQRTTVRAGICPRPRNQSLPKKAFVLTVLVCCNQVADEINLGTRHRRHAERIWRDCGATRRRQPGSLVLAQLGRRL